MFLSLDAALQADFDLCFLILNQLFTFFNCFIIFGFQFNLSLGVFDVKTEVGILSGLNHSIKQKLVDACLLPTELLVMSLLLQLQLNLVVGREVSSCLDWIETAVVLLEVGQIHARILYLILDVRRLCF